MKVFNLSIHVRRRRAGLAARKHTAEPIQSLPLPLTGLIWMQFMPRRNLRERLILALKSSLNRLRLLMSCPPQKNHKHTLENCPIFQDHLIFAKNKKDEVIEMYISTALPS